MQGAQAKLRLPGGHFFLLFFALLFLFSSAKKKRTTRQTPAEPKQKQVTPGSRTREIQSLAEERCRFYSILGQYFFCPLH